MNLYIIKLTISSAIIHPLLPWILWPVTQSYKNLTPFKTNNYHNFGFFFEIIYNSKIEKSCIILIYFFKENIFHIWLKNSGAWTIQELPLLANSYAPYGSCYYLSLMGTKNFTQQWINNNCLKKKTEQKKLNSQLFLNFNSRVW